MSDKREMQIPINSVDFVANVERMPTRRSQARGIYLYGLDNNYPYKLKQLALRSNSLVTAMNTYSRFVQGLGFEGATYKDTITNPVHLNKDKLTPYELLQFVSKEKAHINYAIHVNYNQLGEAVEFTPIPYEFVRKKIMLQNEVFEKFIITDIWHTEFTQNYSYLGAFKIQDFNKWILDKKKGYNFTSLETYAYNPDPFVVREQIAECRGIENYSGQLFYIKDTIEAYQIAKYDSVIDDAQTEAEAKLFSLSSLQNGFSASGIFKYPMNLDTPNEANNATDRLKNLKGAENASRWVAIPYGAAQDAPQNMFESIQQPDIDKLFPLQRAEAKKNIYELYAQPSIINGRSDEGMFNQQSMQDAFMFYNSVTEPSRQQLEIELTTLFSNSIFADKVKLPIEIKPLGYGEPIKKETNENIN